MDSGSLQSIASGLAASSVTGSLNVSLLKSVQNLDVIQVAELFRSIGLGQNVNAMA
jgi:hypothetical protein